MATRKRKLVEGYRQRDAWMIGCVIGLGAAFSGCGSSTPEASAPSAAASEGATTIEQIIPADRLQKIRAALPRVAYPTLQSALDSAETLWYDHEVMTASYQDSVGAQSNATWPDLVAASETVIGGLHDRTTHRWQFPFGTTAGADRATNLTTINFIHLPHVGGRPLSIPIWEVRRNYNRPQWMWVYPNDTMIGEILFIADGAEMLATEIRIRTRNPEGWSTNIYRPFNKASDLAADVKQRRPNWSGQANLRRLVEHLESSGTLTPKTLAARAALAPTFQQSGALDILPDIGDPALVRELLKTTTFTSSYGEVWKESGNLKTYAPSTNSDMSIVPRNYEAGLIEVNEQSCTRCHKEAGRLVSDFYDALYLYGELWGKDGIFSFHPFDESLYPQLRTGTDNRRIDPRLKRMGVFETYDANKHKPPRYPERAPPP